MFEQNAITLAIIGYLVIVLKNIPITIFNIIKAHLCNSVTASSLRKDNYLKINEYILSLNNKAINNHLEYKTEWIGQEPKTITTIGYGDYFIKMDTMTFAKISKLRVDKGANFEPDDRITITIIGLKRRNIFEKIKTAMLSVSYENKIKYYTSKNIDSFSLLNKKSFDNIFNKEKQNIIDFIDNWKNQKDFYNKHEIVYKTGILLYGEPGTGKSTICKAIASYLDYSIHAIDIQDFIDKPEELKERIERVTEKSIILFEDIDCIIADRNNENISDKKKFIIGTVLNILDGINSPDNILFLATTNHIEKIDSAIIRNGRFDLIVEISKIDRDTAEKMKESFNSDLNLDNYNFPINPSYLQNEILRNSYV